MMKSSMSLLARCRYMATILAVCVCVCVYSLSGCSKGGDDPIENPNQPEKPTEATLSLSTEELTFEAKGGLLEFTINSSVAWTITGSNAWCQPGATSGTGNTQVKIIAEAYTGTTDRNVVLTVKAGSLTKTLTVTQKAVQALTLTKDKFDVPQEGGDITVEVKSNIDYTVSIPEAYKEWITEAPQSKAMVTKSFRFSIATNEEAEKREGHIVIIGNELKDTVYVYQTEGQ
ncbi:MAG: BACON domain-containing protein [Odoribacter sp.]|nr:BACON domain-containing protein [Odoribacter sp.]